MVDPSDWSDLSDESDMGFRSVRVKVRVIAAVLVAALGDIIHSKRAAGREKDGAVISILERTLLEEASLSRQAANPIKEDDGERGVTPRKRPRTR